MKRKHNEVPPKTNCSPSEKLDFQNFPGGEHDPGPPRRPKNFSCRFAAINIFLGLRSELVKFWAGSAPALYCKNVTKLEKISLKKIKVTLLNH